MTMQAASGPLVLGIESSCDDTAAAVVRAGPPGQVEILSSIVVGQEKAHAPYGGVVPEIAARAHAAKLPSVVATALREARVELGELDLIAATAGPGLIGGVVSGLTFAKGLALATGVPLVPVNHLAGHAVSVALEHPIAFPYLLLLVSGGHSQILLVRGAADFLRLGTTIDDAAGEAFDKTAKLLGLPGMGGPAVEAAARGGDPGAYALPQPLAGRPGCDFSFSGLKTAIRQCVVAAGELTETQRADLAAAFQAAAVGHLTKRTHRGLLAARALAPEVTHLVAAGGVAANQALRRALEGVAEQEGWTLVVPSLRYCTDNAAMIALAGAYQLEAVGAGMIDDTLTSVPRSRWPLDMAATGPVVGTGKRGRKV
ncbi:Glycoprotease (M22) metalloprotease [Parvularcula bermudensis HTCC2503]|uniref:tRNA N6-adenosine threonylcarbamoyltransferase n=1 Tax=Parvularcula bermudensis (strain ATCC BAA-594 / HTCC2503 / KCTC 12087) TaxID=314260 RepID=E0TD19_PARBH|nr:tRNA (adenosine(37)-N6)-threonylcarbamoyltransferase complex transferase subunit TsaD [Parvularcula bermudensis]ADM08678.1 Glycoprotease (M22) metalloprotease [Parvularcula bermudensis HTCC2503]